MNKRIKKKKSLQQTIQYIYSIAPNEKDYVVLEFDKNACTAMEIQRVYSTIRKNVKNNIIAIPDTYQISTYTKEELIKMVQTITNVILLKGE